MAQLLVILSFLLGKVLADLFIPRHLGLQTPLTKGLQIFFI